MRQTNSILGAVLVWAGVSGAWAAGSLREGRRAQGPAQGLGEDGVTPLKIGENVAKFISSDEEASEITPKKDNQGRWREYTVRDAGASYIALHFQAMDLDPSCFMDIRGPPVGEGAKKRDQSFVFRGNGKPGRGGNFWAPQIRGEQLTILIECRGNNKRALFEVDEYARGFPDLYGYGSTPDDESTEEEIPVVAGRRLEALQQARRAAICGGDDRVNAACLRDSSSSKENDMYDAATAVVRLYITGSSACTGFVIGPSPRNEGSLVLTNQHCIENENEAQDTEYEFMGEADNCSDSPSGWMGDRGIIFAAQASPALLEVSEDYDYALIRLDTNIETQYGYLQLDNRNPDEDERIYIPQHGGGQAKRFGVDDSESNTSDGLCKIDNTDATGCGSRPGPDLGYNCDTEGGSSGSPVITRDSLKVIGLHHCANCNNRGVKIIQFYNDIEQYIEDCSNDAFCDDNNACNGVETCNSGQCVSGAPLICPPTSNQCIIDECNSSTNQCGVPIEECDDDLDSCTDNLCDSALGCTYANLPGCMGLTTTLEADFIQGGNMFDVVAKKSVQISGFKIHCNTAGEELQMRVFMKQGTWVGYDKNSNAWTEIFYAPSVICEGADTYTKMPDLPSRVFLENGDSVAFYVKAESRSIRYLLAEQAVGEVFSTDNSIDILTGCAKTIASFGTTTYQPRMWNGEVVYFDEEAMTGSLTDSPSKDPTSNPSSKPSLTASANPTVMSSTEPSMVPSTKPSTMPTSVPSSIPSAKPSRMPSSSPSTKPSNEPSAFPSKEPSSMPSTLPSFTPSVTSSSMPSSSFNPTDKPKAEPTLTPTSEPSSMPSAKPSKTPSTEPSSMPSSMPSSTPTHNPSNMPSLEPSSLPSATPSLSSMPSYNPSLTFSETPSVTSSSKPSTLDSFAPSSSSIPSTNPSESPSSTPSSMPSSEPTALPSAAPSLSSMPSLNPSSEPSSSPSKICAQGCSDDGNACTIDECNSLTRSCGIPVDCDDGDLCTVDTCDASSGCNYEERAFCQSLDTGLTNENGNAGVMFDIEASTDVEVSGFEIHCQNVVTYTIEIYQRNGKWEGHDTSDTGWAKILDTSVNCKGVDNYSPVAELPSRVDIAGGDTVAFYVTLTSDGIRYYNTPSGATLSDGNISILNSIGKGYRFGTTFGFRDFSGKVVYFASPHPSSAPTSQPSAEPSSRPSETTTTTTAPPLPVWEVLGGGTSTFDDDVGWGDWFDGGSDAYRSTFNDCPNSTPCVRLRDNSGRASSMSRVFEGMSGYSEMRVEFSYRVNSFENAEDFFLEVAAGNEETSPGPLELVKAWVRGTDFANDQLFTDVSVQILPSLLGLSTFPADVTIRFRCDASGNGDQVYIDDITCFGLTEG